MNSQTNTSRDTEQIEPPFDLDIRCSLCFHEKASVVIIVEKLGNSAVFCKHCYEYMSPVWRIWVLLAVYGAKVHHFDQQ